MRCYVKLVLLKDGRRSANSKFISLFGFLQFVGLKVKINFSFIFLARAHFVPTAFHFIQNLFLIQSTKIEYNKKGEILFVEYFIFFLVFGLNLCLVISIWKSRRNHTHTQPIEMHASKCIYIVGADREWNCLLQRQCNLRAFNYRFSFVTIKDFSVICAFIQFYFILRFSAFTFTIASNDMYRVHLENSNIDLKPIQAHKLWSGRLDAFSFEIKRFQFENETNENCQTMRFQKTEMKKTANKAE